MSNYVNLLDVVYPIGSIFIATTSISPADLIGGTWEEKTDYILPLSTKFVDNNGIHFYTIGDLTAVGGFGNITGMTTTTGWQKGTQDLDFSKYIKGENTYSQAIFGFSQNNNNFIWYPDSKDYVIKSAESQGSWQSILGVGRAQKANVASVKFYVRTA